MHFCHVILFLWLLVKKVDETWYHILYNFGFYYKCTIIVRILSMFHTICIEHEMTKNCIFLLKIPVKKFHEIWPHEPLSYFTLSLHKYSVSVPRVTDNAVICWACGPLTALVCYLTIFYRNYSYLLNVNLVLCNS